MIARKSAGAASGGRAFVETVPPVSTKPGQHRLLCRKYLSAICPDQSEGRLKIPAGTVQCDVAFDLGFNTTTL